MRAMEESAIVLLCFFAAVSANNLFPCLSGDDPSGEIFFGIVLFEELSTSFRVSPSSGVILLTDRTDGGGDVPSSQEGLTFPLSFGSGPRVIAPFGAAVDTSLGGSVCYDDSPARDVSMAIINLVNASFPDYALSEPDIVIVTWKDVTFVGTTSTAPANTFQAVIVSDFQSDFIEVPATFVILKYLAIDWTSATPLEAEVGFNGIEQFYNVENTGTEAGLKNLDMMSNTGIPGCLIYRVDGENIEGFECRNEGIVAPVPSSGPMMGGTRIQFIGPCSGALAGANIVCSFMLEDDVTMVTGSVTAGSMPVVECITPTCLTSGPVDVSISTNGGVDFPFTATFNYQDPCRISPQVRRDLSDDWSSCSGSHDIGWDTSAFPGAATLDVEIIGYCDSVPELVVLQTVHTGVVNNGGPIDVSSLCNIAYPTECEQIGAIRLIDPTSLIAIWSDFLHMGWIVDGTVTAEEWCEWWAENEASKTPPDLQSRIPCPCTLQQARTDRGRFTETPDCNENDVLADCSCRGEDVVHCVRATQSSSDCGGLECCYDSTEQLTSNANGACNGGFTSRAHYLGVYPYKQPGKVPCLSNLLLDVYPRMQCCGCDMTSVSCQLYKLHRPSQSCNDYVPPRPAACGGDPHIQSLDGLQYTFNGKGEFTMLEIPGLPLTMQARNKEFTGSGQGTGTYIGAVGICFGTVKLHVEVNSLSSTIQAWVMQPNAVGWVMVPFPPTPPIEVVYTDFTIRRGPIAGYFSDPGSLEVDITGTSAALYFNGDVTTQKVITIMSSGVPPGLATRGLLGIWNGNTADDLTPGNGRPALPITSDEMTIYEDFGVTWRINPSSSCFYYRDNESPGDTFEDDSFTPTFGLPTNNVVTAEQLAAVCEGRYQCEYDYLATGDSSFATNTKNIFALLEQIADDTGQMLDTCPLLPHPENGVVGIYASTNPSDTASYACFEGFVLSRDEPRVCRDDQTWSSVAPFCLQPGQLPPCDEKPPFTCIVRNPFVGPKERTTIKVYALAEPPFYPDDICFARTCITGCVSTLPPLWIGDVNGYDKGKVFTMPPLEDRPGKRYGIISCIATTAPDCEVEVKAVVTARRSGLIPIDGRVTKTASIGDDVVLWVTPPPARQRTRWRKNTYSKPKWDGRTKVTLCDVTEEDAGYYEIYQRGRYKRNQHTVIIVYVRGCPHGKYGVDCSNDCTCINGGYCDEETGACTCPPGFTGGNCQHPAPVPVCTDTLNKRPSVGCSGILFCLPGKCGCTCGPGYEGMDCEKKCSHGRYGAGCTQRCPNGESCDPVTGEC